MQNKLVCINLATLLPFSLKLLFGTYVRTVSPFKAPITQKIYGNRKVWYATYVKNGIISP